jgi:streptogramin lyase
MWFRDSQHLTMQPPDLSGISDTAKLPDMRRLRLVPVLALLLAAAAPSPVPAERRAPFSSLHPAAVLHLGRTADWVLATPDAVWVGSTGPFAVHRIDPKTNREAASVELPGEPCAGLTAGFGRLWVPLCGKPTNTLARVDLKTNRVTVLPVGPAAAEGGIAASGDSVWMVVDAKGALARIDPETGRVRQTIAVPPGSYNPLYSDGIVWVSGHDAGVVTAVEAASGRVLATVPVGEGPRFLTAGAGSIWVLLQGTGEVVRIDARTRRVTARIAAGLKGHGGDIGFGAGRVWPTLSGTPLTEIDARTTDYEAGTVARYPANLFGRQ